MTHTVKSIKVYAVIEQVIEPPFDLEELRAELKEREFRGEVHINQGGVTNIVTKEKIPLTMRELDGVLKNR